MKRIETERLPILVWDDEADPTNNAIQQAKNLANHPLARKHVALMPDYHLGYGMPIGGVFATRGGVVPNAVGVDIGCGMIARSTGIEAASLDRDALQAIRLAIHERVPVGFNVQSVEQDLDTAEYDFESEAQGTIIEGMLKGARLQMGTLGGGNHFLELQKDEEGYLWLMLHSGSRGIGKKVCDHYDAVAVAYMAQFHVTLPTEGQVGKKPELAFLPEGVPEYAEYLQSMNWCLQFAEESRHRMMSRMIEALATVRGSFEVGDSIQTHHNYAAMENHMGENVLVHRKGAVKADQLVIIPGSMGTASYIGQGLAQALSFKTCSHGAGRVMGRKEANRTITKEQAVASMAHVVYGIRDGDYEEMPAAYKDVDAVMANQRDLVQAEHRLTPLAVVKG